MDTTKPKQVRVYLRAPEMEMLNHLVEVTGLKDTHLLTVLCGAALKAAKEVDYRVPLALKFRVAEGLPDPPKAVEKAHR